MPNCSDIMCTDPNCVRAPAQSTVVFAKGHNPKRCGARRRRLISKLKLANERLHETQHALADAHNTYQKHLDLYNEMIRPLQNALRIEAGAHMRWRDSASAMYEKNVKLEQELREVKRDLDKTRSILHDVLDRIDKAKRPWWRR